MEAPLVVLRIYWENPLQKGKRDVLAMVQNCIKWWDSNFRAVGDLQNPFIAITHWFNLTESASIW